jgi:Lar family restriction alleviation protein
MKLEPCPFCGGTAAMQEVERCDVGLSFPDHYVQCRNCGASGPIGGTLNAGEQQAANLWNRRATHGVGGRDAA